MRAATKYPALYQVNTRVWLTALSRALGRPATLDDVPDGALDQWAEAGFDWIWLLSVWQTGTAAQCVSRANLGWRSEFQQTLGDLCDDDIAGSGFAITDYSVHQPLGGNAALARLRQRMRGRGLRLMLDFVPNHMGLGHPWLENHPDYFIQGNELDLARAPQNYTWVKRNSGDILFAYGRDPFFPGWPDTLQINYGNPAAQEAMIHELLRISEQCDGVRCDMAMLVLPDVFERTWGAQASAFWPKATAAVRKQWPDFCFMAEVYWDLEWTLQQQGFDYTYDKRLYDRLRAEDARPVREHFWAAMDYQSKSARFLENHDEPRAAAVFPPAVHKAAAVITFLCPGLRFFHQGQFEGARTRISPHLRRGPSEPADPDLLAFYQRLLAALHDPVFRSGDWKLLEAVPAWNGNSTSDSFVAFCWQGTDMRQLLVAVNYAPHQSQCYLRLPTGDNLPQQSRLRDLLGEAVYVRDGGELEARGLYLDAQPWQAQIFEITDAALPKVRPPVRERAVPATAELPTV